jgi:hypothetical protein
MVHPHALVSTGPGDPPLTPEQKRFNQLLGKLEKARAELLAWQEQALLFAQGHAARLRPLQEELLRCEAALIRRLDALLHEPGARWTKRDRRRMRSDLCDLSAGLIESAEDEALVDEMKALFERHAGHDFETENRESMAAMKEMFEAMSGLDLGDEDFGSEDELARAAHRRMAAQMEADASTRPRRKPGAAERRREREEQEASQSLREVYRKLAAAIHPDRADDDADRERRHALMQRANQAYDGRDLLALLALQLEIEQVDAAQLARTTAARARQYSRLLNDQLREIEAELEGRRVALCMEYGLDMVLPPQAAQLGRLLDRLVRDHRADLAQAQRDLAELDDPRRARDVLRRRWRDEDDDMPF